MSKTQFWDLDEIYDALRAARLMGVDPATMNMSNRHSEPAEFLSASV